jgi:chromosome segregation ATPase
MASVAARIQDRANILVAERHALRDAVGRLAELEGERRREQSINDMRRRHLLEVSNARNEVELDIFKARDQIQDLERSILDCEHEARESDDRDDKAKDDHILKVQTIYGLHRLEMELYLRAFSETIQAREKKIQRRLELLAAIRAQGETVKAEEESFRKEARQLQEETDNLSQAIPTGHDEVLTNLSKRIRETILEVSSGGFGNTNSRVHLVRCLTPVFLETHSCLFSFDVQES